MFIFSIFLINIGAIEVSIPKKAYLGEPILLEFKSEWTNGLQIEKFPQLECFQKKYIPASGNFDRVFLRFILYPQQIKNCVVDSIEVHVAGNKQQTPIIPIEILSVPNASTVDLIGEHSIDGPFYAPVMNTKIMHEMTIVVRGNGQLNQLPIPPRPYDHPHIRYYAPLVENIELSNYTSMMRYTYRFSSAYTLSNVGPRIEFTNFSPGTKETKNLSILFPTINITSINPEWNFAPGLPVDYKQYFLWALIGSNLLLVSYIFLCLLMNWIKTNELYFSLYMASRQKFADWQRLFYLKQKILLIQSACLEYMSTKHNKKIQESIAENALDFAPNHVHVAQSIPKRKKISFYLIYCLKRG